MAASLQWALDEIRTIQKAARSNKPIVKPRWPLIILRTPKGMSGPKELHGEYIEGSFQSHGVPLPNANHDDTEFKTLTEWLESYKPRELFDKEGKPNPAMLTILPEEQGRRMGQRKECFANYQPLVVPDWSKYTVKKATQDSCMDRIGEYLHDVIEKYVYLYIFAHDAILKTHMLFLRNPHTFRIWSPDELISNKLGATLRDHGRNMQWDLLSRDPKGRVIEMLSEHTCQGMLQGYTLTGRTGLFPSYESFMGIIGTMMVQYAKFMKMVCRQATTYI